MQKEEQYYVGQTDQTASWLSKTNMEAFYGTDTVRQMMKAFQQPAARTGEHQVKEFDKKNGSNTFISTQPMTALHIGLFGNPGSVWTHGCRSGWAQHASSGKAWCWPPTYCLWLASMNCWLWHTCLVQHLQCMCIPQSRSCLLGAPCTATEV